MDMAPALEATGVLEGMAVSVDMVEEGMAIDMSIFEKQVLEMG